MRVLFLGTPDFAIPTLQALINETTFEIVAVITQPDRPRGRKSKLVPCEVKAFALEQGLDVYSFEKLRVKAGREFIESLNLDVMVTAAFGQILSRRILDIPRLGCVNVHASLLPKYRGAAPIQWAIINCENITGVTTMLTERGIDCGDILLQKEIPIDDDENSQDMFEKLSKLGGSMIVETIKGLDDNSIVPIKQDETQASHYPMLIKSDGEIDWRKNAKEIHAKVRGTNPWPGAYTHHNGNLIKIWKTKVIDDDATTIGTIVGNNNYLDVSTGNNVIRILEMQIPGKKRMTSEQVLRGYNIRIGETLK